MEEKDESVIVKKEEGDSFIKRLDDSSEYSSSDYDRNSRFDDYHDSSLEQSNMNDLGMKKEEED